jgi:hypothetical protein
MSWYAIVIIYLAGFTASIKFLGKYGDKIGLGDYDEPKTYATMDDYSSNAEAWTMFSIFWPIFFIMLIFQLIIQGLIKLVKHLTK